LVPTNSFSSSSFLSPNFLSLYSKYSKILLHLHQELICNIYSKEGNNFSFIFSSFPLHFGQNLLVPLGFTKITFIPTLSHDFLKEEGG